MNALRDLRARGDDRGMSITELLISMLVTSIALAIVATLFVTVAKSTADSNTTRNATGVAANVMDEVTRVIRSASSNPVAGSSIPAPAIVAGTANALTVIAYVDTTSSSPAPVQVSFALNSASSLTETRVAAVSLNGQWVFTGTSSTRTIAGPLVPGGTLFTYADQTGAALTPSGTGLTAAQRAAVASVTVTVTVPNVRSTSSAPLVVTNTVGMPNLTLPGGTS